MTTFLVIAGVFVVLYIGAGISVIAANAHGRGDIFKLDWKEVLRWPKSVLGR